MMGPLSLFSLHFSRSASLFATQPKMFHIVLVSNEQVTVGAVAARLVQREQVHRIRMDHQWQFPLMHLAITLWTLRPSHVLVRVEKEPVLRRLFAKLCCGF